MQSINTGVQLLELDEPAVMGVINVTHDSFYAPSRKTTGAEILETASQMLQNGAKILDIGGYSSRPGAIDISEEEELKRVLPAIQIIKKNHPNAFVSIDTFRPNVAKQAVEAGATMINDITGQMNAAWVAKLKVAYVCMHMRGTPATMQQLTDYNDITSEIFAWLFNRVRVLQQAGVNDISIDPGIGFAKTIEQNYLLLDNLTAFLALEKPILIGISRKSFIYKKLNISPEEALLPTLELTKKCVKNGARIIRTHDVKETVKELKVRSEK